ncbi:hypothetical protein QYF36_019607 [Acer negundo]|nr:hypothetical protein QYF36_019607 [Acer negundo]
MIRRDWLSKTTMKDRRYGNFLDLITNMAKQKGLEDLKVFCVMCWHLWYLCNDFIHSGGTMVYEDVLPWSSNYVVTCKASTRGEEANFGHFLEEIAFLRVQNPDMKFLAISKGANQIAQSLARIGLESLDNKYWMEEVLACISDLVATDISV